MSRHIIFIDPIEKLIPKKDSSLLLAHALKKAGQEAYILFKDELHIISGNNTTYEIFDFESSVGSDFYLTHFSLSESKEVSITEEDTIHMRLEPPFDLSYMRSLWMLDFIKQKVKCRIINDPKGILFNNEKITSFYAPNFIDSIIGSSAAKFQSAVNKWREDKVESLILKPVDLFQGIGVEKVSLSLNNNELNSIFVKMVEEYKGPIIAQPFQEQIKDGEIRSIYFAGKLLGAIKKVPKEGSYLANIAQGATFEKYELNEAQSDGCQKICDILGSDIPWVAFDIIGDKVSEVNITCPGLLVEVSKAEKKSLADMIVSCL